MAGRVRSRVRRCVICGARLAPDNASGACTSHPPYDPRTDPDFGDWLLGVLRRSRGRRVQPLEELRRVGKVCGAARDARDAIHGHVERLRRNGHHIEGVRGAAGGYVYRRGPNDERVPKPDHERQ